MDGDLKLLAGSKATNAFINYVIGIVKLFIV